LKFGGYIQQQAIDDGWLDMHDKLTQEGLQAIADDHKNNKQREDLVTTLMSKGKTPKAKPKVSGSKPKTAIPSSSRGSMGVSSALKSRKGARSAFVGEVKALLSKMDGKFIHFSDDDEDPRLVIRIPNERGGTTSQTFRGTISEIRRELLAFLREMEEGE